MGKVYIGVTTVGGHKLWGVMGGKRVAGLGGLGEWVGGGRLTAGGGKLRAGHARPLRGVEGCAGAGRERAGGGVKTPPYDVEG